MNVIWLYRLTCKGGNAIIVPVSGWSTKPWQGSGGGYDGFDDGGYQYIIPKGYRTETDKFGETRIYDDLGNRCALIDGKFGLPALKTGKTKIINLWPVDNEEL